MESKLTPQVIVQDYFKNASKFEAFPAKKTSHLLGFRKAAKELDIEFTPIAERKFEFVESGTVIGRLNGMVTSLTSKQAIGICRDKTATLELLKRHGVPTAQSESFSAHSGFEDALKYWNSTKDSYDLVVKPADARAGMGITIGISDEEALKRAWVHAKKHVARKTSSIVLEERRDGVDIRGVVVNGRFACATTRVPAYVIGDGNHTIDELIDSKNALRDTNPYHKTRPMLQAQDYAVSGDKVPAKNELVWLSDKANIHQGGEAFDVTELLSDSMKQLCCRAAAAVPGLGVAGVDLLAESFSGSNAVVIEINTSCNFGMHYFPMYGKYRNPALLILEEMSLGQS